MKRFLPESSDGVSTVISAILILAVITTFVTAINAYYIPCLAAEHEIKHMQEVHSSFIKLAAKTGSDCSNAKVDIPLGDGGLPLLSSLSSSGTLTTVPGDGWMNVSLTDALFEEKQEFEGSGVLWNLTSVSILILNLEDTAAGTYTAELDSNNNISVIIDPFGDVRVVTIENTVELFNYTVTTTKLGNGNFFSLDVLNPVYHFSRVLENTSAPFSLTLHGPFHVEYERLASGNISMNLSTGYFKYTSSNNFWLDQKLIFENGAVILEQGGEYRVRSQPFLTVDEKCLNLYVYNITGVKKSLSGNGPTTINIQVENRKEYQYPLVGNTSIAITSNTPKAWETYLSGIGKNTNSSGNMVDTWFENKTVIITTSDVIFNIP